MPNTIEINKVIHMKTCTHVAPPQTKKNQNLVPIELGSNHK
jgi:hypothetical protein